MLQQRQHVLVSVILPVQWMSVMNVTERCQPVGSWTKMHSLFCCCVQSACCAETLC